MLGKHRLQKPTRFVGLPTKWKMSPKADEIMGNSGTAVPAAVPRAAPLVSIFQLDQILILVEHEYS